MRAVCALALESLVQRRTEDFPEFLFGFAVQRNRLGLRLPALLQRLDRVHPQRRGSAHFLRLNDECLTALNAGFLRRLKTCRSRFENAFPMPLHFAKSFFAQVAGIAPTVGKLMQSTQLGTPIFALRMLSSPGLDLIHQGNALGTLVGRVLFHLVQPGQHRFVGLIASGIEALPQRVIGQSTLVNLLPAVTQMAQLVLHFSATHSGGFFSVEQGLGLVDQVCAHLVGQPTLPSFSVSGCGQRCVQALVQAGVQVFAMGLEFGAQSSHCLWLRRTLAFGDLFFQHLQQSCDRFAGQLAQSLALCRVCFGFHRLVGFFSLFCFSRWNGFIHTRRCWC